MIYVSRDRPTILKNLAHVVRHMSTQRSAPEEMSDGRSARRALKSSSGKLCLLATLMVTITAVNHECFYVGPNSAVSHALVDFGEEGTTIIPFSRIVKGSASGGRCLVSWPDGKEYDATLACTGQFTFIFSGIAYVKIIIAVCIISHFLDCIQEQTKIVLINKRNWSVRKMS